MELSKVVPASLLLALFAMPAMATVTVSSPTDKSTVTSPFNLSATASACSSQSISAVGYSLDNTSTTTIVKGTALNASVTASAGGHTLHVKSWGTQGAACTTDVAITVSATGPTTPPAGPSVSAPLSGASLKSPLQVSATQAVCAGQPVVNIGYSLDTSKTDTKVGGTLLTSTVIAGTGGHTLHVKSWNSAGDVCATDVAVTVTGTTSAVPASATNLSSVQALNSWIGVHDEGTPGTSSGTFPMGDNPSRSGNARHFATKFTNYGGHRYSTQFGDSTLFHNFVYDTWIYIANTVNGIANVEMDINQVIGNGWTVIMGFQCDRWSKTWDYTANLGTAKAPIDKWVHSALSCNPKTWAVNTWHHVQIAYSRTDDGHVTYQYVTFDGVKQTLNATVFSGFALGWKPDLITNFQVDGDVATSGSSDIYLDEFTISSW